MKQRTVSISVRNTAHCRSGSVAVWAWTASIAIHLVVLTVFGVVRLSHPRAGDNQRLIPTARISRVEKFIRTSPITPKPKVKRPVREDIAKAREQLLPASPIFNTPRPAMQDVSKSILPAPSIERSISPTGSINLPNAVEFFGSWIKERKVCYVVDSSGSMRGMFGQVQKNLKKSIEALQPDQYFYIIFFGGEKLLESGGGRLLRATPKAKSDACSFIDSVRPTGQTNAMAALEKAMQVHDSSGNGPAVIYFLTDGFELTTENARSFPQRVSNLLRRFSPKTKINAIGFWPTKNDRKMLETIATQSGGEFILVCDDIDN
jgi:hypothetical protein